MKQRRTTAHIRCIALHALPLSTAALGVCFLLGALLGGAASARGAETMGGELRRYWESYLALRALGGISAGAVWQTFVCFFRASAAVFVLGFASLGVVLIPAVCALQGFLYAYALACFACAMGREGFFLLLVLFALRLMVVLPCTLLLGGAAWETARGMAALSLGRGKRARGVTYGRRCWLRFGKVCVCLLLGAAAELWLVPRLLALLC